jgi:hypothetical protein
LGYIGDFAAIINVFDQNYRVLNSREKFEDFGTDFDFHSKKLGLSGGIILYIWYFESLGARIHHIFR